MRLPFFMWCKRILFVQLIVLFAVIIYGAFPRISRIEYPVTYRLYGESFLYGISSPHFLEDAPNRREHFNRVVCIQGNIIDERYVLWGIGEFAGKIFPMDYLMMEKLLEVTKHVEPDDYKFDYNDGVGWQLLFIKGYTIHSLPIFVDFENGVVYGTNCRYPLMYEWLRNNVFCLEVLREAL